jgi:hypothetical protein
MTAADHILGIMKNSNSDEESARRIAKFMEGDSIPDDGDGNFSRIDRDDVTDVRPAEPGMRCHAVIGDDPQSGPLYCGDPAYLFCFHKSKNDTYYIMCKMHARRTGVKLEAMS